MQTPLTQALIECLHRRGVNTLWAPGATVLPLACRFEPPCSIKWMSIYHSGSIGAFSYAVSGYFFAVDMGRYVSIGGNVQMGRGDHPLDWLSTSPIQYIQRKAFFDCGMDFAGGEEYAKYDFFGTATTRPPNSIKNIAVGHDVWIGNGAYIKPGVNIGNGAVVAAQAVVTKDVPPYAVVAGNPANIKKMRFNDAVVDKLQRLGWWQYAIWDLCGIAFDQIDLAIEQIEERQAQGRLMPYQPQWVDLGASLEAEKPAQ